MSSKTITSCFFRLFFLALTTVVSSRPQAASKPFYYTFPDPPCENRLTIANGPFYQELSVKPNICLGENKHIRFDLSCSDTPLPAGFNYAAGFTNTLNDFDKTVYGLMATRDPAKETQQQDVGKIVPMPNADGLINHNPFYETKCVAPGESASGACVMIKLQEDAGVQQQFTAWGLYDLLATLRKVPGDPLICRIDVHTADGIHFGTGCIDYVKSFNPKSPPACPAIPQP